MIDEKDIMLVEYVETDNGCPALCFCNDISIPITNKTMVQSFINYMTNDMKFKIVNFKIQNLMFNFISNDITSVMAKVNGTFEFIGFVNSNDLLNCMEKIVICLKERADASQA